MAEQQPANGDRVGMVANRLRLLQIDFADQSDQDRRAYLSEELSRTLAGLTPSERKPFLDDLQSRFPTWDQRVELRPTPTSSKPSFDEKELNDAGFLVGRLISVCASLPPDKRAAVVERLREAGLVATSTHSELPTTQVNELRAKLQCGASEKIDAARAVELLTLLADFACSLDQVVWNTWRVISPQGNIKRPAVVQRTMARFLAGDAEVPRGQITRDINMLRSLVAALIGAVSQTGRFAIQHFKSLWPDEIKVLVGSSGFGLESRYWRKYTELAGAMDMAAVQDAIRQAISEYAEVLMRGGGSSGSRS
jgi:hypothetical protein